MCVCVFSDRDFQLDKLLFVPENIIMTFATSLSPRQIKMHSVQCIFPFTAPSASVIVVIVSSAND